MSTASILAALELRLATVTPNLATMREAMMFAPVAGVPYQKVSLITAEPINASYGGADWREEGFFQVMLCYPNQGATATGSGAARMQAERVRAVFARGTTLIFGTITVTIARTPAVAPAFGDADRFCLPIRIRYFAHIRSP